MTEGLKGISEIKLQGRSRASVAQESTLLHGLVALEKLVRPLLLRAAGFRDEMLVAMYLPNLSGGRVSECPAVGHCIVSTQAKG